MTRIVVNTQTGEQSVDESYEKPDWTPAVQPVPASVTKLQLRKACLETPHAGSNWWVLAKAALAAADENTQEEWDLASVIERNNETFTTFAAAIGASSTDIDAVFRLAETK